ncbi:hypothetical protein HanLR1_Chr05g0187211 [Helianthus annuus]|nr:hypothetical protein HanLR1_Chr05g0187211 [Helianthus annuus]
MMEDKFHSVREDPVGVVTDISRSFSDTLLNKEPSLGCMEILVDDKVQAFGDWFDFGLLRHASNLGTLTDLRRCLRTVSNSDIQIKYVGGLYVLLVFGSRKEKEVFVSKSDVWCHIFDRLEDWSGQIIEFERIAWLKIHGVPLRLSCIQVFDDIAAKFGNVVQSAQFSEDGGDLSFAYIGILCNSVDRVNKKIALK